MGGNRAGRDRNSYTGQLGEPAIAGKSIEKLLEEATRVSEAEFDSQGYRGITTWTSPPQDVCSPKDGSRGCRSQTHLLGS